MTKVFVYGTLKTGYWNYDRILKDRAKFLGEALSVDRDYAMYGTYIPLLVKGVEDGDGVRGEMFEIDDERLARCDLLEGHPRNYCREERQFMLEADGEFVTAWVYLYPAELAGVYDRHETIRDNLQWNKFKIEDKVVNVISPSAVGTVVDPSPKPGFVRVRFDGHGDSGVCLPLIQIELAYQYAEDQYDDEDDDRV